MHYSTFTSSEGNVNLQPSQQHCATLARPWFNRSSHLHLLSHSFSTTLLIVMCWQCCLSKVVVTLSHVVAPAEAFPAMSVLDSLVWNSSVLRATWTWVTNEKCEGERQWKLQKNHYLLNTHLLLTPLSKQFPRQPSWSMKVSKNGISDTAMTAPGPTGWHRY